MFHSWSGPLIRVDDVWLATEPMGMRAGSETAWPHELILNGRITSE